MGSQSVRARAGSSNTRSRAGSSNSSTMSLRANAGYEQAIEERARSFSGSFRQQRSSTGGSGMGLGTPRELVESQSPAPPSRTKTATVHTADVEAVEAETVASHDFAGSSSEEDSQLTGTG